MLGWLLPALGHAGDLGRPPRRFLFVNHSANWPSDPPAPGSTLALTVDETAMRDAAYRLRVLPHRLQPIAGDPYAVMSYADCLTREGYVYGPSRMARIDEDINADLFTLALFGQAGARVLMADAERGRVLHERRGAFEPGDWRNAAARMEENFAFIEGTFVDLDLRLAAYRQAIDRTLVETPPVAGEPADRSLFELQQRIVSLRGYLLQVHAGPAPERWVAAPASPAAPMDIRPPARNGFAYPLK